jgi:hypothetical protein
MPSNYALNNVTAPVGAPIGVGLPGCSTLAIGQWVYSFNVDVVNSSILWQLQGVALPTGDPQMADWTPFAWVQMTPGSRTLSRNGVTGIRFYAANPTANPQAIVTIEAVCA